MINLASGHFVRFLNYANLLSALFIVLISIFHYEKIHNVTLYVFAATFVLGYCVEKKWKSFVWTKSSWFFLMFILYYLLTIVWMPFEDRQDYSMKLLEYRLVLLGIGLVGILGLNPLHKLRYYVWVFAFTSLGASLYVLGKTICLHGIGPEFLFQMVQVRLEINYHMAFNYYLNLSNVLVIYMLLKKENNKSSTVLYVLSLLVNYVVLLCSEGRIGFITALVILMMPMVVLGMKYKKLALSFSIIFMVSFIFLFFQKGERANDISLSNSPRVFIWHNAIDLIKEQPMGYGSGDAVEKFASKVVRDSTFVEKCMGDPIFVVIEKNRIVRIHSHNIFLQSMLEFGFVGLVVSLMFYILPFVISRSFLCKERLAIIFVTLVNFLQNMTDYLTSVPIIIYLLLMVVLFSHAEKERRMSESPSKKEIEERFAF